jgi:flagellar FliJ protein
MKSLTTLIKLQKTYVDQQRLIVNKLQERVDLIERAMIALEVQKAQEKEIAAKYPEHAHTYGMFLKVAVIRGRKLALERLNAVVAVNAARDKLGELFEEQKRYEIAEEARIETELKEEQRRETIELDEIGGVTFQRKKAH